MYPRGTQWRKWDLHVHTPASIEHNYSAADPWDRYLSELASLPPEIRVLGINDYWFVDGYIKVREAFDRGDLPNLEAVMPVYEVRCDVFGGSGGRLSRLNLHMICDPSTDISELDAQLRPHLKAEYRLTDDHEPVEWHEVVSPESMERLGSKIIAATPPDSRTSLTPRKVGFNNLNVSFNELRRQVESNTYLRDRVLFAIGKVEWADIRWDAAAAQKKHLINSVAAVFSASPDRASFGRSRQSLVDAGVNARLLHCSDAHHWMGSQESNRLGNSFSWINGDPTFDGLRMALNEYDHRYSSADRPPILQRLARAPHRTIDSIAIGSTGEADAGTGPPVVAASRFDSEIPLNPGFTVIVGNKGQGKSALLDCIALAGNSDRTEEFSFLNKQRFLSDGGLVASSHQVTAKWLDGSQRTSRLSAAHDNSTPALVDYLPQSLIEKICSADPLSVEKRQFEREIERVAFGHVPTDERMGASDLRALLEMRAGEHVRRIEEARASVRAAVARVASLEVSMDALAESDPAARRVALEARVADLEARVSEIDRELASVGATGASAHAARLDAARAEVAETERLLARVVERVGAIGRDRETVDSLQQEAQAGARKVLQYVEQIAEATGLAPESLVTLRFDWSDVSTWQAEQAEKSAEIAGLGEGLDGLNAQRAAAMHRVERAEADVDTQTGVIGELSRERADLLAQRSTLLGDRSIPDSLRGAIAAQERLAALPNEIAAVRSELRGLVRAIHDELSAIRDAQIQVAAPMSDYVRESGVGPSISLEFGAEFRASAVLGTLAPMVNRQKLGEFFRLDGDDEELFDGLDFTDAMAVIQVIETVERRLRTERGAPSGAPRRIESIVRAGYSAVDVMYFLYGLSWLSSDFSIRSSGKLLSELSPGQRGLVLLAFYLMIDLSDRPLLLDQPEENLDNQTVRSVLVPALRSAVSRRQVIAVTHNPNLAVVGDADQIIVANHDEDGFAYFAGALTASAVGEAAVDVLEGTSEAFRNRREKYRSLVRV